MARFRRRGPEPDPDVSFEDDLDEGWRPSKPRSLRRWIPRLAWPVLASVLFVGILFVGVFPTQTYLSQRAEADEKRAELREVHERNAELQARIDQLEDPGEIELMAREQFGLVYPGEEAYAILLPPSEPVALPDVWPFDRLDDRVRQQLGR